MAQYRCLISLEDKNALDQSDTVVNTFYLDTDALAGADDPTALITDALNMWRLNIDVPTGFNQLRGRIYNMSDPEPRQPKATVAQTITASGAGGPREVALCLSYFADTNSPRRRGRMYIGPFFTSKMTERPSAAVQNQLGAIAAGLSALGGINVQWVQHSPTTGEFHNVTDWWVDNEWDTMRSRGLKGTSRVTGTVNG